MGLEDLSIFRPIPGCAILYPSDAFSTEACVEAAANHRGMVYIRTTRPATPLVYPPDEAFPIGGSKVLRKSDHDAAAVIAAGVTVPEALKACDALANEGIAVRVIDAYSVKPLDEEGIRRGVGEAGRLAVVVEDHFEAGGLGEAVAQVLSGEGRVKHLCVRELPRSGRAGELMEMFGISAAHIVKAVKGLCGRM
jgi:transketolase